MGAGAGGWRWWRARRRGACSGPGIASLSLRVVAKRCSVVGARGLRCRYAGGRAGRDARWDREAAPHRARRQRRGGGGWVAASWEQAGVRKHSQTWSQRGRAGELGWRGTRRVSETRQEREPGDASWRQGEARTRTLNGSRPTLTSASPRRTACTRPPSELWTRVLSSRACPTQRGAAPNAGSKQSKYFPSLSSGPSLSLPLSEPNSLALSTLVVRRPRVARTRC